jgi:ankyrin repeat protein
MRFLLLLAAVTTAFIFASRQYHDAFLIGPAFCAIEDNDLDSLKTSVARGLDVNTAHGGMTPLMVAASRGRADAAQTLIDVGARVDTVSLSGATALHFAALTGKADTIAVLARAGADVNAQDLRGTTPLMCAIFTGDPLNVIALLEAGADTARRNNRGENALQIATDLGRPEIVSLLANPL